MKLDWVYIAAYRAFDVLNDEEYDEDMDMWVSTVNPYLTVDHRSIAQCYQDEFENYAQKHGLKDDYSPKESYELVSGFAHDKYPEWGYRFEDISLGEWEALCDMVAEEEGNRTVRYTRRSGDASTMGPNLRELKGKTLKSIEYARREGRDEAWLRLRLNTAGLSVRVDVCGFDLLGREVADFMCYAEDPSAPLELAGGAEPRKYLVGERVTGVEVVSFAASIDGAPLEGRPEDGYDFERMPAMNMAIVVRTKGGAYSFYRRGCVDGAIRLGNGVPTDEELGIEEFRAFWAEGGREVEVRREVFEL